VAAVVLALASTPAAIATTATPQNGVVLWNHLGSLRQIGNSVMGPDLSVSDPALVAFPPGVVSGGIATMEGETGGGGYLWVSPTDFFGSDLTQGTVEVWLQKRIERFVPYETPLVGIFGPQPYDFQGGESSFEPIHAFWSDGLTGGGGLEFGIWDGAQQLHAANDLGWDAVPVGTWVHVAFVWDLDGIGGTADRMRIYRDGVVVASNADQIASIETSSAPVKLLGHHAYSRFGQPTLYMDELRVWTEARVWFPRAH
jgi:hypothetical protein